MIFASLVARLGFDTSAWSSGANRAKSDLQSIKAKNEDLEKSLKNSFGKKSTINEVSEILTGGGVIAGITLLGATVLKLADAWAGVTKAAEEAAEAQKGVAEQAENIRKAAEQREKSLADSKEALLRRQRDTENLTFQKGLDRDRNTLLNDKLNAQDDVDSKLKESEKIIANARAERDRLQKEQEAIKKQQAALSKGFSGEKTGSQKVAAGLDAFAQRQQRADLDKALKDNESKLREAVERTQVFESSINQIRENARQEKIQIDQQYSLKDAEVQRDANDAYYKAADDAAKQLLAKQKQDAEEQRQAAIAELEQDRDDWKEEIKKQEEAGQAGARRAEVSAIRGGNAGIVLEKEADPNTPLLKFANEQLKIINENLKALKGKETDNSVEASF